MEEKSPITFVVTGFGPFNNTPRNPTTTIAECLVNFLYQKSSIVDSDVLGKIARNTKSVVLETSVEDVKNQIAKIKNDIEEGAASCSEDQKMVVILHLGVDNKGTQFKLESFAYNNADFRVPDERGYRPTKELISYFHRLDAAYETALDVAELVASLNEKAQREHVTKSVDPGRFVCNYTYYYSMEMFGCSKAIDSEVCPSISATVRCLFLHVPPFSVIPEEDQLEFVANLMVTIYEQNENIKHESCSAIIHSQ